MINIITIKEISKWNQIVKSFDQYDIYYLGGYVKTFQLIGDGNPKLLFYESDDLRGIIVLMERTIENTSYLDTITPYGYGGWIFEGNISHINLVNFKKEYFNFAKQYNIVDNFTRYHPIIKNALILEDYLNVIPVGRTIAIDLTSPEIILSNMSPQCRNKIRKAQKNNIEIRRGHSKDLIDDFIIIYNETMRRDEASDYYYFSKEFYLELWNELEGNMEVFYAIYQDKKIAIAIILYANGYMHYHLSGSLTEFRKLAPVNLLLYEAALWGYEQGFKTFHLGGGLGGRETDLYKFKESFNRNSNYTFHIGKDIFLQNEYENLVYKAKRKNPNLNLDSSFFPLYRS